MILSAFLKLDVAGFSSGIGVATEVIKGFYRISEEIGQKLKGAFDLGGEMSDVASQIGETAGEVLVLKQAFDDTGVGGDNLAQTLGIMRRNLSDISSSSSRADSLKNLGLDAKALAEMGAAEQLETIGTAIKGLDNPTKEAGAAMEIFGRSGLKMLTFLKDPAAIGTARKSLGSLATIIDDNANAFDAISDRIGRFKMKSMGLWAGIAEGLTPLVDEVTSMFDGVDVAAFGQRIGNMLGGIVELFRQNSLGEILSAAMSAGWGGFLNFAIKGTLELGNTIVTAFQRPFAYISAGFQKVIEEVIEKIAKIPGVGDLLGISGFKASSFADNYEEQLAQRQANNSIMDDFLKDFKPFATSIDPAMMEMWEKATEGFKERLAGLQGGAAGGGRGAGGAGGIGGKGGAPIASDSLARIGGYVGGKATDKMQSIAEKQLRETIEMRKFLERIDPRPVATWGG